MLFEETEETSVIFILSKEFHKEYACEMWNDVVGIKNMTK